MTTARRPVDRDIDRFFGWVSAVARDRSCQRRGATACLVAMHIGFCELMGRHPAEIDLPGLERPSFTRRTIRRARARLIAAGHLDQAGRVLW